MGLLVLVLTYSDAIGVAVLIRTPSSSSLAIGELTVPKTINRSTDGRKYGGHPPECWR